MITAIAFGVIGFMCGFWAGCALTGWLESVPWESQQTKTEKETEERARMRRDLSTEARLRVAARDRGLDE